jgi:high-affinity iron transporter
VWIGALAGLLISLAVGVVFVLVFYLANTKLLTDKASLIFKGCICWLASLLITTVAFAMLRFYNMERRWRHKLEDAVAARKSGGMKWSMLLLAGSATLREGIESVLFLTGVSAGSSVKAVIIPGAIGILLGGVLGLAIYYTGRSIKSLKWFFIASALLLLFIAAGMVVNGTAFFQLAGLFGTMWPYEWRPWSNRVLWDTSACCDPNSNEFWALVRALFGYQEQPMNLQLLYYCLFWGLALGLLAWKWYHGTLTDAKEAALAEQKSFAAGKVAGAKAADVDDASADDDSANDAEMGASMGVKRGARIDDSPRQSAAGGGAAGLSRQSKDNANSLEQAAARGAP